MHSYAAFSIYMYVLPPSSQKCPLVGNVDLNTCTWFRGSFIPLYTTAINGNLIQLDVFPEFKVVAN